MDQENKPGSDSDEPTLTRTYKIIKPDAEIESVIIEGAKATFKAKVVELAKLWYGENFKLDHRSRTITVLESGASEAAEKPKLLTNAALKDMLKGKRTGSILLTTPTTAYAIRIVPTLRKNKFTYKLLTHAARVRGDYTCSKAQLVKFDALARLLKNLAYSKVEYFL